MYWVYPLFIYWVYPITIPEINSSSPENGWLEYDRFLLGVRPIFRGEVLVFGSVALRKWLKNEGLHRHTHTHTKFCCIDTQYDSLSRLCWVSKLNFRRIYIHWHWFIPEITLLRWVIKHAYEWFSMYCSSVHTGSPNLSRKQDRASCKTWIWCWDSNFVFFLE